ncbi:potassium-transporting ATPase subunit KdpC [Sphingomonas sp. 10B4]|uniref:potassium-transporting ATPase subunit KdpC n=1 Tax=Sphingomonas sp. 10B4 TaxID=3048575 RepID=UPI002AB4100D|nr:potassium-transporting ATPase subunit KdpC [Sphingomonas sp. 10B4]MDY7524305.1 potassium-transporting ATPase subunit KdpC [Sphingomonas sp. 10B4]MEB0282229.1 potassium-transporting ATPase subunit KdpC [Sphingomonas sp. 10B4]
MLTETIRALRPTVVFLLLITLVTGLLYPAAITGIAQVVLPVQANGSVLSDTKGQPIGSSLIAQGFTGATYFHPRPSAAGKGYDASSSSATNLAPGSKDLRDAIATRVKDARKEGMTGDLPADLVTTSASGLDPDLSPAAAFLQAPRVAKARGLDVAKVNALVTAQTETPILGIIGDAHVNVLLLNRQLDALAATAPK